MELILVVRVLLRRWYLLLIPVVIAAAFTLPDFLNRGQAASGGFSTTVRYTAAQQLDVPGRDGDYQDIWLASELTVNALTEWVRTSRFIEEVSTVAAANGVDFDPATLGVSSDNQRSIGVLYLNWPDPEQLEIITNAAIDVLQTRTQDYFPQLQGEPARVTLLDKPVVTPASPALTNRFAPFIRIGLGLLAGLALAFLVEYLDDTLRRREDVEALGLPVIASIPRHRK